MDTDWLALANVFAGQPCIIAGKGPSFGEWAALGHLAQPNTVFIGINHAANAMPFACFGVSTDDIEALVPRKPHVQWVRGIPYRSYCNGTSSPTKDNSTVHEDDFTFVHTEECDKSRLEQTREQLAVSRKLYCHGSSAHPAIHFAWYLGCQRPVFFGLDGGSGYAPEFTKASDVPPNNVHYPEMRRVSLWLRDTLWPQPA